MDSMCLGCCCHSMYQQTENRRAVTFSYVVFLSFFSFQVNSFRLLRDAQLAELEDEDGSNLEVPSARLAAESDTKEETPSTKKSEVRNLWLMGGKWLFESNDGCSLSSIMKFLFQWNGIRLSPKGTLRSSETVNIHLTENPS